MQEGHPLINKLGTNSLLMLAYTALSVVFTYPVAFLGDRVAGIGGDGYFYLWDLWWYKEAILHLQNPYYTDYLFYPTGISLAFASISQFSALASVPLQLLFGLPQAFNLVWLLSFILAGYGTYLLVHYLTRDWRAAFVAGIIFAFAPYHTVHALGHLNLVAVEWIPFFALFLLKSVREGGLKNYTLASLFLVLCTLSDYNYGFFAVSFTLVYLVYLAMTGIKKYRAIGSVLAIYSIMVLPFVYPLFVELARTGSHYMYHGGYIYYSADLLGFVYPSTLNVYLGNAFGQVSSGFMGIENVVFAGYLTLALSLVALFKNKSGEVRFWGISVLIFSVLCLGPRLHVNGVLTPIYLPFQALTYLPVIAISRAPGRWDVLVMLCLAVLAGFGMKYIFDRLKDKKLGALAGVAFAGLILFEFLVVPYPSAGTQVSDFYHQIAGDGGDYALYEVPDLGTHLSFPDYMFYQTVHGKKLITGYTKVPDYAMRFTEDTPFVRDLYLITWDTRSPLLGPDILAQNATEVGPDVLRYYGIGYVILHKDKLTGGQLAYADSLLRRALGESPAYYDNGSLIVYKVDNTSDGKRFMLLGSGWEAPGSPGGIPERKAMNNATLTIHSPYDGPCNLSLSVKGIGAPGVLRAYCDGELAAERPLATDFTNVTVPLRLDGPDNVVTLRYEASQKKADGPVFACRSAALSAAGP